jgi:hypothetical protein
MPRLCSISTQCSLHFSPLHFLNGRCKFPQPPPPPSQYVDGILSFAPSALQLQVLSGARNCIYVYRFCSAPCRCCRLFNRYVRCAVYAKSGRRFVKAAGSNLVMLTSEACDKCTTNKKVWVDFKKRQEHGQASYTSESCPRVQGT